MNPAQFIPMNTEKDPNRIIEPGQDGPVKHRLRFVVTLESFDRPYQLLPWLPTRSKRTHIGMYRAFVEVNGLEVHRSETNRMSWNQEANPALRKFIDTYANLHDPMPDPDRFRHTVRQFRFFGRVFFEYNSTTRRDNQAQKTRNIAYDRRNASGLFWKRWFKFFQFGK